MTESSRPDQGLVFESKSSLNESPIPVSSSGLSQNIGFTPGSGLRTEPDSTSDSSSKALSDSFHEKKLSFDGSNVLLVSHMLAWYLKPVELIPFSIELGYDVTFESQLLD